MPLTPADLAGVVAEALGLPLTTVKNYDRKLMEAGLRTKKGHGRGSALMGPKDAAKAVGLLAPKRVIPIHYGTFPPLVGDPQEFARLAKGTGTEVSVLRPGEAVEL